MSERVADPFGGRAPTSHERMTGLPWDASYHNGPAPWDVGPQPAIVRLAGQGVFTGAVLDAGCGTGENAMHVASLGPSVLGVDVAETALAIARGNAADRKLDNVEFMTADALRLDRLGRTFDTILDCGLCHTFDADERPRYAAGLARVAARDATLHLLCFSDEGPDTGPHPVSGDDLAAAFNRDTGWRITSVEPDRVLTRFHGPDGAPAWLARVERT